MKTNRPLSIKEKRNWLADIFRDKTGEYSQAEKFKAMVEDTRLALIPEEGKAPTKDMGLELLEQLPPPL